MHSCTFIHAFFFIHTRSLLYLWMSSVKWLKICLYRLYKVFPWLWIMISLLYFYFVSLCSLDCSNINSAFECLHSGSNLCFWHNKTIFLVHSFAFLVLFSSIEKQILHHFIVCSCMCACGCACTCAYVHVSVEMFLFTCIKKNHNSNYVRL